MKQLQVTEKTIGENTFYLKPFPAFVAAGISGELAALVAPLIGSLAPVVAESADPLEMEVDKALPGLADAFSTLSGDRFEQLMKRLLIDHKNISVEPAGGQLQLLTYDLANEVFCGEIQDMFSLCFEVIKLNFGSFFKRLEVRSGSPLAALRRMTSSTAASETSISPAFPSSN